MRTDSEMTGLEKASVLLMSLGADVSKEVLDRLSPEERDLLDAQLARMRSVKSDDRKRVLGEVSEAVKSGKAIDLEPFHWLESFDHARAAGLLIGERPRTISLVLSHLSPSTVASILSHFDEKTKNSAAAGLLQMSPVSDDVIKTVDEMMRKRAFGSGSRGVHPIIKSIGDATTRAKDSVLAAMSRTHTAHVIDQEPVFTMPYDSDLPSLEDLLSLPDAQVRVLMGDVDVDDLCLTLRVSSEELQALILRIVPASTAELLRERLKTTTQIKIREIEIAQRRVLGVVRRAIHGGDY